MIWNISKWKLPKYSRNKPLRRKIQGKQMQSGPTTISNQYRYVWHHEEGLSFNSNEWTLEIQTQSSSFQWRSYNNVERKGRNTSAQNLWWSFEGYLHFCAASFPLGTWLLKRQWTYHQWTIICSWSHMVHYQSRYGSFKISKENKGLLVLGYLFQVSERYNDDLSDVINAIPLVSRIRNASFKFCSPDILKLFKEASNDSYYYYIGSLTTGDCSEGVHRILFNQIIPISTHQVSQFRKMCSSNGNQIRSNYRETPSLNCGIHK